MPARVILAILTNDDFGQARFEDELAVQVNRLEGVALGFGV